MTILVAYDSNIRNETPPEEVAKEYHSQFSLTGTAGKGRPEPT
jgi:hypothetical protein